MDLHAIDANMHRLHLATTRSHAASAGRPIGLHIPALTPNIAPRIFCRVPIIFGPQRSWQPVSTLLWYPTKYIRNCTAKRSDHYGVFLHDDVLEVDRKLADEVVNTHRKAAATHNPESTSRGWGQFYSRGVGYTPVVMWVG